MTHAWANGTPWLYEREMFCCPNIWCPLTIWTQDVLLSQHLAPPDYTNVHLVPPDYMNVHLVPPDYMNVRCFAVLTFGTYLVTSEVKQNSCATGLRKSWAGLTCTYQWFSAKVSAFSCTAHITSSNLAGDECGQAMGTRDLLQLGLARTVYIHRIWPYIWWFPCQKYRIPIHRIYMVLANLNYSPKGIP